jgi:hypothetical protein
MPALKALDPFAETLADAVAATPTGRKVVIDEVLLQLVKKKLGEDYANLTVYQLNAATGTLRTGTAGSNRDGVYRKCYNLTGGYRCEYLVVAANERHDTFQHYLNNPPKFTTKDTFSKAPDLTGSRRRKPAAATLRQGSAPSEKRTRQPTNLTPAQNKKPAAGRANHDASDEADRVAPGGDELQAAQLLERNERLEADLTSARLEIDALRAQLEDRTRALDEAKESTIAENKQHSDELREGALDLARVRRVADDLLGQEKERAADCEAELLAQLAKHGATMTDLAALRVDHKAAIAVQTELLADVKADHEADLALLEAQYGDQQAEQQAEYDEMGAVLQAELQAERDAHNERSITSVLEYLVRDGAADWVRNVGSVDALSTASVALNSKSRRNGDYLRAASTAFDGLIKILAEGDGGKRTEMLLDSIARHIAKKRKVGHFDEKNI